MTDGPEKLQDYDLEAIDETVREHLIEAYLHHPTRGPYVTSQALYRELEDDIDDRFTPQLFGIFCESRPYLEQWTRAHGGSYRYRIIAEELDGD